MTLALPSRGRFFSERSQARMTACVALSLLLHGFLLSLQFGIPGLGLPGLELPWSQRRAQTPELSVRLSPAPAPPPAPKEIEAPSPRPTEPAAAPTPPAAPPRSAAQFTLVPARPPELPKADVARRPAAKPRAKKKRFQPPVIVRRQPAPDTFTVAPPAPDEPLPQAAVQPETPEDIPAPPVPDNTVAQLAEEAAQREREAEASRQEQAAIAKREQQELEARRQAEDAAAQQAAALAAQQQAQLAAQDEEQARQRSRQLEASKQEEEARARALRLEAQRQDDARLQEQANAERRAMELEARKQVEKQAEETARQQAAALARQKQAEELAAAKAQELAHQEALAAQQRIQAENLAAAAAAAAAARDAGNSKPAATAVLPKGLSGGDLAGRALEQVKKLDLRSLPQTASQPDSATETSRRRSIFGSVDRDIGLSMYIESWRLKIERNGRLNYAQSSKEKARYDPIVTVALRSDGSIEDIVIDRSSGRPELDDAVRRILRLNARYGAFPPELARRYDVIEIRRIWSFDETLRIIEEVR